MFFFNKLRIMHEKCFFGIRQKWEHRPGPRLNMLIKPIDFSIFWVRPVLAFLRFRQNYWKIRSKRETPRDAIETMKTVVFWESDKRKTLKKTLFWTPKSAETLGILVPNEHAQGVVARHFLRPKNHPTRKNAYKTCRCHTWTFSLGRGQQHEK